MIRILEDLFTCGQSGRKSEAVPATCKMKGFESFGTNNVGLLYNFLYFDVKFSGVTWLQAV